MSFQFKQFFVDDSRCAMKVGTDGVLLGAYVPEIKWQGARALDIGTGCGLVALMMAQKSPTLQIDAIDLDETAVEQAKENFEASPWSDRLHGYTSRLQDWKPEYKYDLIVSNPPYFRNSLKNPDKARQTARHTDTLSYEELIVHSMRLLNNYGTLVLILTADAKDDVRAIADTHALPARFSSTPAFGLCYDGSVMVFPKKGRPAKRAIVYFDKIEGRDIPHWTCKFHLYLEDDNGGRSDEYQNITKDFYL